MKTAEIFRRIDSLTEPLRQRISETFANTLDIAEYCKRNKDLRWTIYGAGKNTIWLQETLGIFDIINPVAVFDDNATGSLFGTAITNPAEAESVNFDAVLISSKDYENVIYDRLIGDKLFKDKKLVRIYNDTMRREDADAYVSEEAKQFVSLINAENGKVRVLYFCSQEFFSIGRQINFLKDKDDISTFQLLPHGKTSGHLQHNSPVYHCNGNFYELVWILASAKADYIHCYLSMFTNYLFAFPALFSAAAKIYETVDVSSFFLETDHLETLFGKKTSEIEKSAEKMIFEGSDILLVQSGNAEKYLDEMFNITGEKIRFSPLAEKSRCIGIKQKKEPVKIAYAGIVTPTSHNRFYWGDTMLYQLASVMEQAQIYFDIYPNKAMGYNEMYSDYSELAERSSFFSLKQSVAPDRISQVLSDYHFGSMLYFFEGVLVSAKHLSSVVPTKFITYIEAGLPVLVSEKLSAVAELVDKYNTGLVIQESTLRDPEKLKKVIENCDYNKMQTALEEFRNISASGMELLYRKIKG